MKKLLLALTALCISGFAFAKSDLAFRLCPVYEQQAYKNDDGDFGSSSTTAEIGVINYNFIDEKQTFGVFEMLGIGMSTGSSFDFSIGAAFGSDLNEVIRFNGGLGLNFLYHSETTYEADEEDFQLTKTMLGLAADMAMKLTPNRLFSPVIGVTFYYDPICISQTIKESKASYDSFKYFNRFAFSPYINFCINLN